MIYSILSKNNILLIASTIISYFTWPTMGYIGLFIYIYYELENGFWNTYNKRKTTLILVLLIISPLVIGFFVKTFMGPFKSFLVQSSLLINLFHINNPNNIEQSIITPIKLINGGLIIIYLFIIFWHLLYNFNYLGFIRVNIKRGIYRRIFLSLILLFLLTCVKNYLYSSSMAPPASFIRQIIGLISRGKYPLQFVISHISYYGPSLILLIIFYKDIISYFKSNNFPLIIIFMAVILLSTSPESRFYVFR